MCPGARDVSGRGRRHTRMEDITPRSRPSERQFATLPCTHDETGGLLAEFSERPGIPDLHECPCPQRKGLTKFTLKK
jgi:hypothetical protein